MSSPVTRSTAMRYRTGDDLSSSEPCHHVDSHLIRRELLTGNHQDQPRMSRCQRLRRQRPRGGSAHRGARGRDHQGDSPGDGRAQLHRRWTTWRGSGNTFLEGRESRRQHGESLAQRDPDRFRLGSSILMQARRHDRSMPFTAPSWARAFSREDLDLRLYARPVRRCLPTSTATGGPSAGGTLARLRHRHASPPDAQPQRSVHAHDALGQTSGRDGEGLRRGRALRIGMAVPVRGGGQLSATARAPAGGAGHRELAVRDRERHQRTWAGTNMRGAGVLTASGQPASTTFLSCSSCLPSALRIARRMSGDIKT